MSFGPIDSELLPFERDDVILVPQSSVSKLKVPSTRISASKENFRHIVDRLLNFALSASLQSN